MTQAVIPVRAATPADDPVLAALADPEVGARLLELARAVIRRPGIDPADVVQIAFERAISGRTKFNPALGSVFAWLTGFVRNVAREQMKKVAAAPHADGELDRFPTRAADENEVEVDDLRAAIHRHLATLPEPFRRAVGLRHLDGLEYPAVADRLGVSEVTARQRVCRGVALLRTLAAKEVRS